MRVLSLSHRLQHPDVDNHHIFNAPTIFDYEAIVVDTGGVFDSIRNAVAAREEYVTHSGLPVVNGESLDGVTGIADVLERRTDEFTRALERGAVIAVFAHAPARLTGVVGQHGLDRYFFLPAPEGMRWNGDLIRGGEGPAAGVVDHGHPFVPVFDAIRSQLLYRAYFNERAEGFARHARVFVRSSGGAPVGVEFPVLNGRVIFLPTPRVSGAPVSVVRAETAAIIDAMREALGRPDEDRPRWVANVSVPGLPDLERDRTLARAAQERAEAALEEAIEAAADRERLRDALWLGGEHALLPAVLRCAEAIGFEVTEATAGEPVLKSPEGELQLVVAGANEAVDMAPHYRLRQRLDALIESRSRAARGLIVANGQRLTRPEERKRELTNSLRVAAESVGYAVLAARALFDAACTALEDAPEEALASIRRRLVETDGIVELDDLLAPPAEPAADDEPAERTEAPVNGEGGSR